MTASLPRPNNCVTRIQPYKGGESSGKAGAIKLSSNENPYGPAPAALEAYKNAGDKLFLYPDGGATGLRRAIAETRGLDAERVVCGAGSDEIIALLCASYLSEGDTIVQSEHGFLMYAISALRCGAETIYAPERELRADVSALAAAVRENTRIIFIANPNNPTGSTVTKAEIVSLLENVPAHVLVVVDAAYAEYVERDDYSSCEELTDTYPNLVVLHTFSKIYGLAALRVGWSYSGEAVADILNRARGPFNVCAPGLTAAEAAIRDTAYTEKMRGLNTVSRAMLTDAAQAAGLKPYPSDGNFVLIDIFSPDNAARLDAYLREHGVFARNVSAYRLPSCLRVSAGTEEQSEKAAALLRAFAL